MWPRSSGLAVARDDHPRAPDRYQLPGPHALPAGPGPAGRPGGGRGQPGGGDGPQLRRLGALGACFAGAEGRASVGASMDVPPEIDEQVAAHKLAALGVRPDTLDARQQRYARSWQHGTLGTRCGGRSRGCDVTRQLPARGSQGRASHPPGGHGPPGTLLELARRNGVTLPHEGPRPCASGSGSAISSTSSRCTPWPAEPRHGRRLRVDRLGVRAGVGPTELPVRRDRFHAFFTHRRRVSPTIGHSWLGSRGPATVPGASLGSRSPGISTSGGGWAEWMGGHGRRWAEYAVDWPSKRCPRARWRSAWPGGEAGGPRSRTPVLRRGPAARAARIPAPPGDTPGRTACAARSSAPGRADRARRPRDRGPRAWCPRIGRPARAPSRPTCARPATSVWGFPEPGGTPAPEARGRPASPSPSRRMTRRCSIRR